MQRHPLVGFQHHPFKCVIILIVAKQRDPTGPDDHRDSAHDRRIHPAYFWVCEPCHPHYHIHPRLPILDASPFRSSLAQELSMNRQ
jgi:hypothetical protein